MYFSNIKKFSKPLVFPELKNTKYINFTAFWNNAKMRSVYFPKKKNVYYKLAGNLYESMYKLYFSGNRLDHVVHKIQYDTFPFYVHSGPTDLVSGYQYRYILKTGALWNQKIEHIQIYIKTKPNQCNAILVTSANHKGHCVSHDQWFFEANDMSLNEDFIFSIIPDIENKKLFTND